MNTLEQRYSTLKTLYILSIIIFIGAIGMSAKMVTDERNHNKSSDVQMVYDICQETRTTPGSDVTCGIAQDYTNTEYLCKANSSSVDNICWVESK